MSKINHRYENALESVIGPDAEITENALALMNAAGECDRYTRLTIEASRMMSARFAEFADDLTRGFFSTSSPTTYGTINDITRDQARLDVARESLITLIRLFYGKAGVETFRDAFSKAADS